MMPSDDELSCQEVVGLVTEYLEAALLPTAQARFEEHIADCSGCQAYIQQIQQTIAMLRKLAEDPLFPETRQQLLHLFQTWKNMPHPSE
ncbi:MAG TPA: zf-HC2 domain-containing protein [Ktedonobacterales bacterium]|nr:zf-HC2 domain-containing protein [Ktedonobacterales bacterium]